MCIETLKKKHKVFTNKCYEIASNYRGGYKQLAKDSEYSSEQVLSNKWNKFNYNNVANVFDLVNLITYSQEEAKPIVEYLAGLINCTVVNIPNEEELTNEDLTLVSSDLTVKHGQFVQKIIDAKNPNSQDGSDLSLNELINIYEENQKAMNIRICLNNKLFEMIQAKQAR